MEVHKHPHHITHKKKWGEYLLEFFMIFFAVFLGFIAENVREHIVNHQREKKYIQSMLQDLESDTTHLANVISVYQKKDALFDTVFALYPTLAAGYNPTLINSIRKGMPYPDFIYTDRTIQQLKNSGGMSLIRNQAAANAITEYDLDMRKLEQDMNIQTGFFNDAAKSWREIFSDEIILSNSFQANAVITNKEDYLLKSDRATLGRFYNELYDYKSSCDYIKNVEKSLKQKATELMRLLKKEYHFENE